MRDIVIFYAPDGMNGGHRPEPNRQSSERPASRPHEFEYDHDDGLVHEHHWARTSPERK